MYLYFKFIPNNHSTLIIFQCLEMLLRLVNIIFFSVFKNRLCLPYLSSQSRKQLFLNLFSEMTFKSIKKNIFTSFEIYIYLVTIDVSTVY